MLPSPYFREFLGPSSPKLRLFCLPHAGGGGGRFRAWSDRLDLPVQICPVSLPGREGRYREAPVTDLRVVSAAVVDDIKHHLDLPFAFAGISFGALLAFEIAGSLQEAGATPDALFVASHRAPHRSTAEFHLHLLDDDLLVGRLQELGGIDPLIARDQEFLDVFLGTIRADLHASETYMAPVRPPLVCPLFAYAGLTDKSLDAGKIGLWQKETVASIRLHVLNCGHFLMRGDDDLWLSTLKGDLASVLSRRASGTEGEDELA